MVRWPDFIHTTKYCVSHQSVSLIGGVLTSDQSVHCVHLHHSPFTYMYYSSDVSVLAVLHSCDSRSTPYTYIHMYMYILTFGAVYVYMCSCSC